jgi:hypothetical protein
MSGTKAILWPWMQGRQISRCGNSVPGQLGCNWLQQMADWLKTCQVQRVVLQTTGVYWIPVQDVLEKAGFEVAVVDARGTKNLPGRKSDVRECQWIRKLDIYGLLRGCFQLPDSIRSVRTIWRLRQRWVEETGRSIRAPTNDKKKARHRKPPRQNRVDFDLATELARVMGADLTVIDGIKFMTMQTIYSELGPDLSAFPVRTILPPGLCLRPNGTSVEAR